MKKHLVLSAASTALLFAGSAFGAGSTGSAFYGEPRTSTIPGPSMIEPAPAQTGHARLLQFPGAAGHTALGRHHIV